ncbi:MAG: peptidylprolyl isomerase [bacterium]|nr:peptidylprolyl isomerase [bacterium]
MKNTIIVVAVLVVIVGALVFWSKSGKEVAVRVLETPPASPLSTETPSVIVSSMLTTQPEIKEINQKVNVTLETSMGNIGLELDGTVAPLTVGNFVTLAKSGFYDGTAFHRIISNFMIQGGDPLSKDPANRAMQGTGDPGYKFKDEFNTLKLVRGSLAMANSGPNTNGSQFFIVTAVSTPWLDGKHTNFGKVTSGMDVIDKISAVERDGNDNPLVPVVVKKVLVTE